MWSNVRKVRPSNRGCHKWRSGQFFGGAKDILPKFPQICLKNFYATNFLLTNFLHLLVHLYFPLPSCHTLENIAFGTWNLVLNNPTEKVRWAVQEQYQKQARSVLLNICLTVLTFDIPFTFQLLLSARNLIPSWGRSKAASFSENIYVMYVACWQGCSGAGTRGNAVPTNFHVLLSNELEAV